MEENTSASGSPAPDTEALRAAGEALRAGPAATGPAAHPPGGAKANPGFWARAAENSADAIAGSVNGAMRRGPPLLRDFGIDFGNWLASISWGKFTLLSILLLIFGGLFSSIIFSSAPSTGHIVEPGSISVDVHVVPLDDGRILIDSAAGQGMRHSPMGSKKMPSKDDGVLLQIDGDGGPNKPAVRVDKDGIRVLADDAGQKVSVVIDHSGVRVERIPQEGDAASTAAAPQAPANPPRPMTPKAGAQPPAPLPPAAPMMPMAALTGTEVLLPDVHTDPEKIAAAVEAARSEIENLLQDQVDNKLEALSRDDRSERTDWLMLLVTMTIVALIAVKVVLGSKTRAEFQARKASATAAQEGLKRQLAEAQLKMMQAQVEPHFLFNTLASVDYLIETDPARASRMQKNLIQYLRAAVPQMRQATSNLGREILQSRSYLEILKVRMDERLQFSINVPQGLLSAAFPPMMLLTLVENAIKHGLEPKPAGGTLSVSAVVADGKLRVSVADSGMGFGKAQRGGTGVGLVNVRERLQALYGPAASLVIDANSDGGTIATILVPYQIEPGAASTPAGGFPSAAAAV
jgi:signal transduction histidine kinase